MTIDAIVALSLVVVVSAAFAIILLLLLRGFELKDFFRWFFMIDRSEKKEPVVRKPLDRERERKLLMDYCRDTALNSEHKVERKFNSICLQTLEDNPEICTMDELMMELDKIDKNLFNNLFKGD